jgi:hypothetical protein
MLLHIKTLSGGLPTIDVPADATTNDLKRRIYDICPETVSKRLRVMKSKGARAQNKFIELKRMHQPIASYGVKDGSELSMVFEDFHVLNVVFELIL